MEDDKCRLCGEHGESVHQLLSGCKELAQKECVKQHNNTSKVLTVKWAVENRLLPENAKWYTTNWERGQVIEEDTSKKTILLII